MAKKTRRNIDAALKAKIAIGGVASRLHAIGPCQTVVGSLSPAQSASCRSSARVVVYLLVNGFAAHLCIGGQQLAQGCRGPPRLDKRIVTWTQANDASDLTGHSAIR